MEQKDRDFERIVRVGDEFINRYGRIERQAYPGSRRIRITRKWRGWWISYIVERDDWRPNKVGKRGGMSPRTLRKNWSLVA